MLFGLCNPVCFMVFAAPCVDGFSPCTTVQLLLTTGGITKVSSSFVWRMGATVF
uniref:Uncharacterized protein n=1 Tax=Arundo donax TaxID=35708 RepID=A0A0A9EC14_ARUDO